MKAYKGFDKNLQCRGFQYEIGKEYKTEKAELCEAGFHACEEPIDVLRYYPPSTSRYCEVELDDVSEEKGIYSQCVGKKICINKEISIEELAKAQKKYVKKRTKKNNTENEITTAGYGGVATAGDEGIATAGNAGVSTAGYGGVAITGCNGVATTGNDGVAVSKGATETGNYGVAVVRGENAKAKGGIGSLLVIAEEYKTEYEIKEWKAVIVDGEKIKADTWYRIENGELTEC